MCPDYWRAVAVVGLGLLAGCNRGGGEEKYIPPESNARDALTAALAKWKDGEPRPAEFPLGKVKVTVLDDTWGGGAKLIGFDIVGEETSTGGPRAFNVRLTTDKGQQSRKYYVFGIDPLWVCDEAGYKKMSGG